MPPAITTDPDNPGATVSALLNDRERLNPSLVAMVTRLAALEADVHGVQTRAQDDGNRNLSLPETDQVTRCLAEMRALTPAIATAREQVRRAQANSETAAAIAAGAEQVAAEVPRLLPSAAQIVEMRSAAEGNTSHRWIVGESTRDVRGGGFESLSGGDHNRASVTTTLAGIGTATMAGGGNALPEPRRIATAAGLSVENVAGISSVAFPVFASGTATAVAEGLTKAEYSAITAGSATPQMISVWTDSTRQALLSMPGYERRLLAKHAALLAKAEDALLVARVLASGPQTMTAGSASQPYAETLLRAAALALSSDVATAPNLALINPGDIAKFFPAATTTGAGGESPTSDLKLGLHGMTVYPTTAVTAGTAIVGAWAAGSHLVSGMRPTVLVDSMSQLKKNLITHLSEEAVTLAVDEPLAFVSITNFAA